jgi:hypothetical protein
MSDDSPSTWLLGGGGLLSIGAGLKWLWDKVAHARAARERKIEQREGEYVAKLEARLSKVEKELDEYRWAITLLVADVARREPGAAVLREVQRILGSTYPLRADNFGTMQDPLDTLRTR